MEPVSIISVTYRSLEDTKRFVESVLAMTEKPYELIMCANGVKDAALQEYLRSHEERGNLKLLWNPTNIGVRAFGQVMKLASHDYIFRCDSDVIIEDPYWTKRMVEQHKISSAELGPVAAVGTANTRGYRIRRTKHSIETDMIMSNTMAIHKPTAAIISYKLRERYQQMRGEAQDFLALPETYPGFHVDIESTLEFARLGGWWWDTNYGGADKPLGYGADDMWWSLLARWAGLKLVTSNAGIRHFDASARSGYESERHRLVARGFQYLRTSLSLIMKVWEQELWNGLPNNLPVLADYRKSGEVLVA